MRSLRALLEELAATVEGTNGHRVNGRVGRQKNV
jgi:hypothetical protein